MRDRIAVALIVSLVVLPVSTSPAVAHPGSHDAGVGSTEHVPTTTNHTTPPDPPGDVLGWEGGYWYNESIAVDQSDGLNETELTAVVNRSMARVERVRGWEFQRPVPVEVISRAEFADRRSGRYANVSDRGRLFHRIRGEARFYINESADPLATLRTLVTGGVAGFYSPSRERIVVISENTTAPRIDEITLAQELFHALQDRRYPGYIDRLSFENAITSEDHNRIDVVVEGDGNYVDYRYAQRCEADWDCLLPEPPSRGGSSGSLPDINFGLFVTHQLPYSDGVDFVRDLQKREGWAAVDGLYGAPPGSTEQVIHPEKFRRDPPTDVTVRDRSADAWRVLERPNGSYGLGLLGTSASNMTFGEAGIFTMLWYPSFRETVETGALQSVVIPYRAAFNLTDSGRPNPLDPYDYTHPASAGWDGDLLVPYVTDGSSESGETGYVWKIVWDSPDDAVEFRDAYYEVLAYHGGERVGTSANTWRIPDDRPFGDAFHVVTEGNTTVIVNAPAVEELKEIRADVNLSAARRTPSPTLTGTPDPTPAGTPSPTLTATPGPSLTATPGPSPTGEPGTAPVTAGKTQTETGAATEAPGQSGPGILGAVIAMTVLLLVTRRLNRGRK